MKRVLIYFKGFSATPGGSEQRTLLFLSYLQKKCQVTLALCYASDLERATRTYGIPVDLHNLEVVIVKPRSRLLQWFDNVLPFYRTWKLKKLARQADVCISTMNIADFGRPAHYFIISLTDLGDNAFTDFVLHRRKSAPARFAQRFRHFVAEHLLRPLLGVRSPRAILHAPGEKIYLNSHFVEQTMRSFYGTFNSDIVYPVTSFQPTMNNVPREPLKVNYLGRIDSGKRILDIIEIVETARRLSGQNLTLDLAGELEDNSYVQAVKAKCASFPWCTLVGKVFGESKERFLLSGTYAIHAQRDEAFGIAITEYLKAGLIPVVPDEGGAPEVVNAPELAYHDNRQAAEILARLVSDGQFREDLQRRCTLRANDFDAQAQHERLRNLMEGILAG
ncbi:MAG: glycosyltransferase [Victivallales bacterium]|nr:glycosyltransferase [Victivallales bacterium]